MNAQQLLGLGIAAAGVWYAFTARSMPLRIFVGATAGAQLLNALPRGNG